MAHKAVASKATIPKAAKVTLPVAAPSVSGNTPTAASGVSLADIAAVKALIGRLGAGQLKGLIDVLAG